MRASEARFCKICGTIDCGDEVISPIEPRGFWARLFAKLVPCFHDWKTIDRGVLKIIDRTAPKSRGDQ